MPVFACLITHTTIPGGIYFIQHSSRLDNAQLLSRILGHIHIHFRQQFLHALIQRTECGNCPVLAPLTGKHLAQSVEQLRQEFLQVFQEASVLLVLRTPLRQDPYSGLAGVCISFPLCRLFLTNTHGFDMLNQVI